MAARGIWAVAFWACAWATDPTPRSIVVEIAFSDDGQVHSGVLKRRPDGNWTVTGQVALRSPAQAKGTRESTPPATKTTPVTFDYVLSEPETAAVDRLLREAPTAWFSVDAMVSGVIAGEMGAKLVADADGKYDGSFRLVFDSARSPNLVEVEGKLTSNQKIPYHYLDGAADDPSQAWRSLYGWKGPDGPIQRARPIDFHTGQQVALVSVGKGPLAKQKWGVVEVAVVREGVDTVDVVLMPEAREAAGRPETSLSVFSLPKSDVIASYQGLPDPTLLPKFSKMNAGLVSAFTRTHSWAPQRSVKASELAEQDRTLGKLFAPKLTMTDRFNVPPSFWTRGKDGAGLVDGSSLGCDLAYLRLSRLSEN